MEENKRVDGPPGGFWPRAAALIVDSALLMVCLVVLGIVVAIVNPGMARPVMTAFFIGIPCLYFTLATALWGCTVGKWAFNLRVARLDGAPVSLPISFWRWFCSFLFSIPLGLGYWVGIFQKDKRTLADLSSGTKVVLIRPYSQVALVLILVVLPFCAVFVGGILAAIAIPRFAQMLEKAREGATKGSLGTLKSAAAAYYGDHQGKWPADLEKDLVPKYLDSIPAVKATGAFIANSKSPVGNNVTPAGNGEAPAKSGTGWLYDSISGKVYVNSTVKDSKGIPYSFYGFE